MGRKKWDFLSLRGLFIFFCCFACMYVHTGSVVPHTTESTHVEHTRTSYTERYNYLAKWRASLVKGQKVTVKYIGECTQVEHKARSKVYSKAQYLPAEFLEHVDSGQIRVKWPTHSTQHHTCTSLHLASQVHPAEYSEYPLPKCVRYSVAAFFKYQ